MAYANPGRKLEDILSCCLCMELYEAGTKTPKALPCQHTFCVACLDKLNETAIANDQLLQCPTCKAGFVVPDHGAHGLPTNYSMQEMVEFHQNLRVNVENTRDENADITCAEHSDRPVIMVCTTCAVGLCTDCMKSLSKSKHIDHELDELKAYLAGYDALCKQNADHLRGLCLSLESAINEQMRKIQNQQKSTEKEIDMKAEDAISKVRAWQIREKGRNWQLLDQARNDAKKAAKNIHEAIDNANHILASRKANPSNTLPVISFVEEVSAKIPELQTLCNSLLDTTPPVYKLAEIDIRPYNRVLRFDNGSV